MLRQFHNVLLYMMLFASLVTALLGFWVDSAVILLAVVVNALIGFVQEGKAANALDAIRDMLSLHALVLRDGQRQALDAERLVPGDVVLLASGDRVPADLRLFETKNFHVDESALTGESVPVEKGCVAVAIDALLGDRRCMAYSGTLVTSGQARGVVVATAGDTELGRIGTLLREVRTLATPLLRQIASFSRWLALAILLLAGATFVLGTLWQGQPMVDMFMLVVALTASAIPEGLPAIMTVILALGVQRMARRNAIVSRLPAVETLGSVTVICSDKTGTLTRNEMTVQRIVTADQVIEVSGAGYAPPGWFQPQRRRPRSRRTRRSAGDRSRGAVVQRGAPAPGGRGMATGGRPHRRRAAQPRPQAGPRSAGAGGGTATQRCDSVRVRASLHGHPAPRPRRPGDGLPEGRAGAHPRHVRG